MKKITVALLFGGKSGEHEVSLRSAASILKALDREKYDVIPIGITKDGQWRSEPKFLEAAFPDILSNGRTVLLPPDPLDNSLMQVLVRLQSHWQPGPDRRRLPSAAWHVRRGWHDPGFAGHGQFALRGCGSSRFFGRDGQRCNETFAAACWVADRGFPRGARPSVAGEEASCSEGHRRANSAYPCFVKPANLGSSVGISKVKNAAALDAAMDLAAQYDRKIIIEKGLEVREIECSVLGNDDPLASLPGEIVPSHEFYDYEAKYLDESSRLLIPAPLEESQTKTVQELAIRTFLVTECSGLARVDFFLEKKTNLIYVNEINTLPGFTSISMYPKLWQATGLGYSELIDRLIQLAIERHQARQSKKTTY